MINGTHRVFMLRMARLDMIASVTAFLNCLKDNKKGRKLYTWYKGLGLGSIVQCRQINRVRVRRLAQGHVLDTGLGIAEDRTSNLPVPSQPGSTSAATCRLIQITSLN